MKWADYGGNVQYIFKYFYARYGINKNRKLF